MGKARNLGILLGEALHRIYHYNTYLRAFNSHSCSYDGIFFDSVIDAALSAQTCGIYKDKLAVFIFHIRIRCVAGSARDIGDYHSVLTQNGVDERRLADIGLADNGDLDGVVLFFLFVGGRQMLTDGVEQITRAHSVDGRDGYRIAETEIIKFIVLRGRFADGVALVDTENYRLAALLEHGRDLAVGRDNAGAHISDENYNIRAVDSQLSLAAHLL